MSDALLERAKSATNNAWCSRVLVLELIAEVERLQAKHPVQTALDDWYQKYIAVPARFGAAQRSEMVCMDALAEIGQLVGWVEPND